MVFVEVPFWKIPPYTDVVGSSELFVSLTGDTWFVYVCWWKRRQVVVTFVGSEDSEI